MDRHGLCPRDGKTWSDLKVRIEGNTHFVIARRERSEGRGNPSCLEERGWVCLFAYWFTVDRHGLRPRDDKSEGEWGMIWAVRLQHTVCHCEEDDSPTRQSTACNGGDRVLQYARGSQSIATGLRPRDEKGCRANFKKLGFFFFWGTRGFTVAHKENSSIALTFAEGDNRINTSDHIAPNADCNCPH